MNTEKEYVQMISWYRGTVSIEEQSAQRNSTGHRGTVGTEDMTHLKDNDLFCPLPFL